MSGQDARSAASTRSRLRFAHVRYTEQLLAAIERHEQAQNWATWDSVVLAAGAVRGNELERRILDEEPAWQLDAEGRLPA